MDKINPNTIRDLYRSILDGAAGFVKAGLSRRFAEIEDRVRKLLENHTINSQRKTPTKPLHSVQKKSSIKHIVEPGWG